MKVHIKNRQRLIKINQQRIRSLLRKALHLLSPRKAELSILFVNDRRMRILNLQYRGVDRTTDVLSFPQIENPPSPPFNSPLSKGGYRGVKRGRGGVTNSKITTIKEKGYRDMPLPLGDIVINLHRAKRQAAGHGLTFNEELRWLLIHGLLHLIGYEHEKGGYNQKKMRKKERELLNTLE
jgi:probable rRNA maturation factor